jgi:hypothetical protein
MIRTAQARAARKRYREMAPVLNEQSRRRFVALEVQVLGGGGVSVMARISGLARSTIYHGGPTGSWTRRHEAGRDGPKQRTILVRKFSTFRDQALKPHAWADGWACMSARRR